MRGLLIAAFGTCLLVGCDDGSDAADLGAGMCVESTLIAQCPAGTSPVLGAQAESACAGAVGGVVEDAIGQAAGQCYGAGSCRVVCTFDVPCRCGIAAITAAGVECASCEGAASCGNGLCEGGEDPVSCPIDCGARCEAGERRCDGDLLQECDLQGRWETLPCPSSEVCSAEDGPPMCVRDVEIIGGDDAGVGDAGPVVDDSRIIPGPGVWPEIPDLSRAEATPRLTASTFSIRLEDGGINNRPTRFATAMRNIGGIRAWWLPVGDPGIVHGLGRLGILRVDDQGELALRVQEPAPPVDEAGFCAAYGACNPAEAPAECPALYAETQASPDGDAYLACTTARMQADCEDPLVACTPTALIPIPIEDGLGGAGYARRGARIHAPNADRSAGIVFDLETGEAFTHAPFGNFIATGRRDAVALSHDGRTAAQVATDGFESLVIVWDVESGERRGIIPVSGAAIVRIALSPDGAVLAAKMVDSRDPATDDVVSFWRVDTEERIFSIRPPPVQRAAIGFFAMKFSPDGRTLAVDNGEDIEIWSLGDAPEERHLLDPGERLVSVSSVHFSPDGRTLALVGETLGLWNTETGQRTQSFPFGRGTIKGVTFDATGQRALMVTQDAGLAMYFTVLAP